MGIRMACRRLARSALLPLCAFMTMKAGTALAAEGMPQLDFGNALTGAQVVWLALIFLALYLLLSKWALPQVAGVLELRATAIATDLDAARRAKADADASVAELTKATREAHASAQAEIAQAVASAKAAADSEAAVLNARLDGQIAEAEQRIAQARASAMGALERVATDTAREVVTRLTGTAIPAETVNHAVTAALAARAQ